MDKIKSFYLQERGGIVVFEGGKVVFLKTRGKKYVIDPMRLKENEVVKQAIVTESGEGLILLEDGNLLELSLLLGQKETWWGDLKRNRKPLLGGNLKQIVCGRDHFLTLDQKGRVNGWGSNQLGQLGREESVWGTPAMAETVYREPFWEAKKVVNLAAAGDTSLAIDEEGLVWQWGFSFIPIEPEFAQNWRVAKFRPEEVQGLEGIVKIITTENFQLGLDKFGQVFTWGSNEYGQLGNDNSRIQRASKVESLPKAKDIAISFGNGYALGEDGEVWRWGGVPAHKFFLPHKAFSVDSNISKDAFLTIFRGTLGSGIRIFHVERMLRAIIKEQISL